MKILFLSHYFPPEVNAPATRTYEHCKQWVKNGHEVTVISCVPHHPMGKAYPGYRNRFYQSEEKDGIRAIKIFTYITANEGFAKRTFNYFFYMVMAVSIAPFVSRADVVISTSPQFFNGLAGYFVSRIKRCPWVLEIRDLWPESILAVGAINNKWIIKTLVGLEKFAYKNADRIVSVTYSFLDHFKRYGIDEAKMLVIRNGVDLSFYSTQDKDLEYARQLGIADKFVAAYVGTHGMAHGLDTIVEAAQLSKEPSIVYLMAGDGADRERLAKRIKNEKIDNVLMLGQLPKDEMPRLWSITDISLVLLKKKDLFKSVIPSKIFESMAMRIPIILGVQGESQEIIVEAESGICIEPENSKQLADAVTKLHHQSELCRQLGDNGERYVKEHFDRQQLATKYEQILMYLVKRK